MEIEGSTALVTGANRGLGAEFVRRLSDRGARRVYAASRTPIEAPAPGVEVIALDVTDPAQVREAAARAGDVTLLVNNAGISTGARLTDGDEADIRREMETHFFGTLSVVRAFAPVLAANGGGAILNVLSVLSWLQFGGAGGYGAAKAAEWALTDSVRLELRDRGTQVTGLFVGAVDTDMMADYRGPKNDPSAVVAAGLDGLRDDANEVLADAAAEYAKRTLALDPRERYTEPAS